MNIMNFCTGFPDHLGGGRVGFVFGFIHYEFKFSQY